MNKIDIDFPAVAGRLRHSCANAAAVGGDAVATVARVNFLGWQEVPVAALARIPGAQWVEKKGFYGVRIFNLLNDVPGHAKDSTVTIESLEGEGLLVKLEPVANGDLDGRDVQILAAAAVLRDRFEEALESESAFGKNDETRLAWKNAEEAAEFFYWLCHVRRLELGADDAGVVTGKV